ncbi:hypothetical protein PF005_g16873 [Phytophthora fragariae]|uniref:Uncharacterized protein n=1 Tax=Phytophthora fragariae TaxID=53985 RepID=A0A6A3X4H8_9STRA|nr:hypothetical protein PF005_g16873 [Phytophthora fragariae]
MSSSLIDTPAPSSPTVAATDPATGVYTSAPVVTSPAGSPTPLTVEAAANTSAPAPTTWLSGSDNGPPAACHGARAARPQAERPFRHVALPPLDRDAVRASIGHLTGVSDHVTALADLEGDHEDLQRRFRELRDPIEPLEEELARVYAAADPFAAIRYNRRRLRSQNSTSNSVTRRAILSPSWIALTRSAIIYGVALKWPKPGPSRQLQGSFSAPKIAIESPPRFAPLRRK